MKWERSSHLAAPLSFRSLPVTTQRSLAGGGGRSLWLVRGGSRWVLERMNGGYSRCGCRFCLFGTCCRVVTKRIVRRHPQVSAGIAGRWGKQAGSSNRRQEERGRAMWQPSRRLCVPDGTGCGLPTAPFGV